MLVKLPYAVHRIPRNDHSPGVYATCRRVTGTGRDEQSQILGCGDLLGELRFGRRAGLTPALHLGSAGFRCLGFGFRALWV
jgi:hypothetical protein